MVKVKGYVSTMIYSHCLHWAACVMTVTIMILLTKDMMSPWQISEIYSMIHIGKDHKSTHEVIAGNIGSTPSILKGATEFTFFEHNILIVIFRLLHVEIWRHLPIPALMNEVDWRILYWFQNYQLIIAISNE